MDRVDEKRSQASGENAKLLGGAAIKALVLPVVAYPLIVVMASMVGLFQNRPFSFAGCELLVVLTGNSAIASVTVNPEFVSMIGLFAVSTLAIWGIEKLLAARKERIC